VREADPSAAPMDTSPARTSPELEANREFVGRYVNRYSMLYGLSPQERRLLLAAVDGVPDKHVADHLGISRSTISTYWNRIFSKTECRSQRDVLAHMLRTLALRSP
jgi:DNA-binding CsgD family transcriptional regulator